VATTATTAKASTTSAEPAAGGSDENKAFTDCLAANGIKLPDRPAAGVAPGGLSAADTQKALAACGDKAGPGAPAASPTTEPLKASNVGQIMGQLGVTDPTQIACAETASKGADFTKPEGQGKVFRAALKCAPDAMARQGASDIRKNNPTITETQATCLVKATFQVVDEVPDADLVGLLSSNKFDAKLMDATVVKAKDCGLTEAVIRTALSAG
jgi:hypothetical protein